MFASWIFISSMCYQRKPSQIERIDSMLLCIFIVTKPQQATDMSADNLSTAERLSKKQGKMSNIENNVSSKDIISQHTRKPERGLYIL